MKKDIILEKMFLDTDRWIYAIEKGIEKDIDRAKLKFLTDPDNLTKMYTAIRDGKYVIAPPHTAQIPKDTPGEFRTVYVNEPIDRVFLSLVNDLLCDLTPDMVHPRCKSYQRGIGCGIIVKEASGYIGAAKSETIGFKSDLSKYFDSVPLEYIDKAFDMVEERYGHSAVIDVLRKYYHSDWYFDEDNNIVENYQSLKQGCAVASWLANVILYDIDDKLSKLSGFYVRYSDDMLYIGEDYDDAMHILTQGLADMRMQLNPKKIEYLSPKKWFKFLGFSLKGTNISLSHTRIKKFQKEIEDRTIKARDKSYESCLNAVLRYLYKGNGEYCWATLVLSVINVRKDIDIMNCFVMDCLRAKKTGKTKVGGLGFVKDMQYGCIQRGIGRNVRANRMKVPQVIEGYKTLVCMQNALRTGRSVFDALTATM